MRYAFIQAHRFEHAIRTMCRVLRVHHSGYYAWLKEPTSARARENLGIVSQIKEAWIASGTIYGYRKIHDDLQDLGVACGEQRVYRLMKADGLRSQTGYKPNQLSSSERLVYSQIDCSVNFAAFNKVSSCW